MPELNKFRTIKSKPIGIYRSKLEQNWAQYLVQRGIPFINEPQYYGNWLPDMRLTEWFPTGALLEIKPTTQIAIKEFLSTKAQGIKAALDAGEIVLLAIGHPENNDVMLIYWKDSGPMAIGIGLFPDIIY